jgi:hypothetical protein
MRCSVSWERTRCLADVEDLVQRQLGIASGDEIGEGSGIAVQDHVPGATVCQLVIVARQPGDPGQVDANREW